MGSVLAVPFWSWGIALTYALLTSAPVSEVVEAIDLRAEVGTPRPRVAQPLTSWDTLPRETPRMAAESVTE